MARGAAKEDDKKDESPQKKASSALHNALMSVSSVVQIVFAHNVSAYFWWSSAIFLSITITLTVGRVEVKNFFCAMEPREDGGGRGCDECASVLMMCYKNDECYRKAMNITYYTEASRHSMPLYQGFFEATLDIDCNELLEQQASNPVDMICAINNMATADSTKPTEGCKTFHCEVLKSALNAELSWEDGDLSHPSGVCTNHMGTKTDEYAEQCVCNGILPQIEATPELRTCIESVCGFTVLEAMCPWGDQYPSFCPPTTPTTTWMPPAPTAGGRRLGHTGDASASHADPRPPGTTGGGSRAPVPGAAPPEARASGQPSGEATAWVGASGAVGGVPSWGPDRDARDSPGRAGCGGRDRYDDVHTEEEEEAGGMLSVLLPRWRRLDDPAPAPAPDPDADADDWTVGDWSPCTCYMQCIPGARTRLVQCMSSACKSHVPETTRPCECHHCADCSVISLMLGMMVCFAIQSFLAFFVFLSYTSQSSLTEDLLIKLSCKRKVTGCVCKNVSPLVRMLIVGNAVLLTLLILRAFFSRVWKAWMVDCPKSRHLRTTVYVVIGFYSFQLVLAMFAKQYTRKPPWLYVPERLTWPTPLKQIQMLTRLLGP